MLGISNAASVKTKRSLSTKNSLTSNVRTSADSTCTASVPPSSGLTALCSWGKFRRLVTGCIFPLTDKIVFDLSDIKLSSNTHDFIMSGRQSFVVLRNNPRGVGEKLFSKISLRPVVPEYLLKVCCHIFSIAWEGKGIQNRLT